MPNQGEGGSRGARYAAAVCVMYWLLLSYPLTLAVASVATLFLTLLIYLKTLLRRRDSLARLTCRDSALSHFLTRHCHAFRRALQLPLWCRNRHVQSLLALCAWEPGVQFERQYLQLSDKGLVALDWELGGQHLPHGRPMLLVLPDLPMSALQVGAICHEAFTFGLKAVVVNRRGQGGTPLNTPKILGYGDASDLREVIDFLRQEGVTLSAVGIGTGGDLLLSYLGQFGSSAYLKSAVCVSPSFGARNALHRLRFPYSWIFLAHLKHAVLRHAQVFGDISDAVRRAWTVKEFDRRLHCEGSPSEGAYPSLDEFWAENEPLREADEIGVPVLCVSSLDDPVCSPADIQHELFRTLPNLFLLTLPQGGHGGFRPSLHGLSWADNAAVDFVLAMMTYHTHHGDVSSSCAHTGTQTDVVECFDFQCRAEDEMCHDDDVESCPEDNLEEEEKNLHEHVEDDGLCLPSKTKDSSPNGHCRRAEDRVATDSGDREVIVIDRLTRTPTEGHGLR
ncbi:hypothetical protein ACOMHN_042336 [Nucella lapillus]